MGSVVGRGRRAERFLSFLVPTAIYLTAAFLLALKYHSFFGDAQAREADGFYVFFSRDPHLAAIGFVWNPGTSIAEMPLILLKGLFPALTHEMLAAGIVSALAMGGACYQAFRFMEEERVGPIVRWGILACFALNPMSLSYGANGMSEALFCLCLVGASRHLARWLRYPALRPLVLSALYVGLGYVVRNEAIAAAAAGTFLVFGATYLRQGKLPNHYRRAAALTDAVIFVIPALAAFLSWAAVSWIIVGHPFEQYSSAFGTSSQLKFLGLTKAGGGRVEHLQYVAHAMWLLAPVLPVLLVVAGYRGWRHRNAAVLGVVAILGAVCMFEVLAYTAGQIAWSLRYVIYVIPFSAMVAACAASTRTGSRSSWMISVNRRRGWQLGVALAPLAALAMLLPGVFTTENTELHSSIDSLDQQAFQWILFPHAKASARWMAFENEWQSINLEARKIDSMHLPRGAIMVDTEEPCVPNLILESSHPTQFFIPNDSDFQGEIGSPYEFGVRYLMVAAPTGYGSVDPINVEYPTLYVTGAGIATLFQTITMSYCPTFRLYKLTPDTA